MAAAPEGASPSERRDGAGLKSETAGAHSPPAAGHLDIYRAADLLIEQDGEDASIFAAMQADKRLEARDMEGGAIWRWVTRAVKELLDKNPPAADTAVH